MLSSRFPHRRRALLLAFTSVTAFSAFVVAQTQSKIIGAKINGTKLYAIVKSGDSTKNVEMPNAYSKNATGQPEQFLIGEDGSALVYESRGTAKGGYENESAAVKRYHSKGTFSVLLDETLGLDRIREYRSSKGRTAYVISMADGGAGIPYVYVCSTVGKVWEKRAVRVSGARNGKLILKRYADGEEAGYPDAKPIATLYMDLDTLLASKQ